MQLVDPTSTPRFPSAKSLHHPADRALSTQPSFHINFETNKANNSSKVKDDDSTKNEASKVDDLVDLNQYEDISDVIQVVFNNPHLLNRIMSAVRRRLSKAIKKEPGSDASATGSVPEPNVARRDRHRPRHRRPSMNESLTSIFGPSRHLRDEDVRGAPAAPAPAAADPPKRRTSRGRAFSSRFFGRLGNRILVAFGAAARKSRGSKDADECEVDATVSTLGTSMGCDPSDRSGFFMGFDAGDRSLVPATRVDFSTRMEVWVYDA